MSANERSASCYCEQRRRRSGFIGLAGRPNVGKSTLVNEIVGSHVAIVSVRPQTTRRAIRGIATDTEAGRQLVLVDLPGVQRPRDVLTERMQRRVERELAESDVALLVVNGEEGIGPGDRFIAEALLGAGPETRTICAVNKVDRTGPNQLVPVLSAAAELEGVDEVFPVSARSGEGLAELIERLGELVPEGCGLAFFCAARRKRGNKRTLSSWPGFQGPSARNRPAVRPSTLLARTLRV